MQQVQSDGMPSIRYGGNIIFIWSVLISRVIYTIKSRDNINVCFLL